MEYIIVEILEIAKLNSKIYLSNYKTDRVFLGHYEAQLDKYLAHN